MRRKGRYGPPLRVEDQYRSEGQEIPVLSPSYVRESGCRKRPLEQKPLNSKARLQPLPLRREIAINALVPACNSTTSVAAGTNPSSWALHYLLTLAIVGTLIEADMKTALLVFALALAFASPSRADERKYTSSKG